MRFCSLILLLALCAGCAPDDPEPAISPDPPQQAPTEILRGDAERAPAEAAELDPAGIRSLYDSDRAADAALAHAAAFRDARTDADFRDAYDRALRLEVPDFGDDLERASAFANDAPRFGGLIGSCAAECTVAVYALDLAAWQAAARSVEAGDALAFFDALEVVYGETPRLHDGGFAGYPTTFEQTWDYGGFSRLGTGRFERALDAIARADRDGSAFADRLRALRDQLVADAAETACIGSSPQDARAELERLRQRPALTASQRAALGRQRDALRAPAANGIETNCADFKSGGCTCASG